ncbi:MAG: hypothetical protein E6K59_11645, partial [Nitrospirae bacterium]
MAPERAAWLALIPPLATALYYALPATLQRNLWITFIPQLAAYAMLALWIASNTSWRAALRLDITGMRDGLKWGALVGVALGAVNLS